MRAASIQDGRIVVEERADPVPREGEVLIHVRAAGINGADLGQRAGRCDQREVGRHAGWSDRQLTVDRCEADALGADRHRADGHVADDVRAGVIR